MRNTLILAMFAVSLFSAQTPAVAELTADQKQAEATAQMAAEANAQAGMPGITNFTEKKLAKMLYELRDQEGYVTFTYLVNRKGHFIPFCRSIGYGLPYAVQYSNPERIAHQSHYEAGAFETMPQPEPNGLFMPDALSATWIICIDGNKDPRVLYIEPKIMVSPFKLNDSPFPSYGGDK